MTDVLVAWLAWDDAGSVDDRPHGEAAAQTIERRSDLRVRLARATDPREVAAFRRALDAPSGRYAVTQVLDRGLNRRIGAYLRGDHARVVVLLLDAGADMPEGVAVCNACGVVFRPARKASAAKCRECHALNASTVPMLGSREHADSPGFTLRGASAGTFHVRSCDACGRLFPARTSATTYCGDACKQRAKRARDRGEAVTPPDDPWNTPETRAECRRVAERLIAGAVDVARRRPPLSLTAEDLHAEARASTATVNGRGRATRADA